MASPPAARTPSPRVPGPRVRLLPLQLAPDFPLPIRKDVRVPVVPWPQVADAVRATLRAAGFDVIVGLERPDPASVRAGRPHRFRAIAERGRMGAPMTPASRLSVYTLLGAGIGLGIFDAVAVNDAVLALPWAIGGITVAVLLWYRYGRSFESDVVVVVLRGALSPTGELPAGASLAWLAGHVFSEVRAGDRIGHRTEAPPRLAGEVVRLIQDFQRRLPGASAN
jgi:hypothetical protein